MAATCYTAGTLLQGLLVINYPDYDYQRWHGTMLFYAVMLISLFVNTYLARYLPRIESLMLIFHVMGFFGVLVPLLYLAPHNSPSKVFANFQNSGGWSSDGLSFLVGFSGSMVCFLGQFISRISFSKVEAHFHQVSTALIILVCLVLVFKL